MPRRRRPEDTAAAALAGAAAAAAADVQATQAAPTDPTAAAFFDVDNTMMVGASIYHFARGLTARGFFTTRDLARFAWQQLSFRLKGQEDPQNMRAARENALAFVAGREVEEIVRLGEEIYDDTMADKIWSGTWALAQQHLEAGQRVWLVTATPVELATLIARRLGLTGALGTVAEVEDGRYTGRLVGEPLHGPAKAEAIRALAEREGLDLERCTAYSDSINDLPMLSMTGRAVAINPDPDLRKLARERGWEVRDFRTARKAARIGLPTAAGVGAITGGIVAGVAFRRRHAGHDHFAWLREARPNWSAVRDRTPWRAPGGLSRRLRVPGRPQPQHSLPGRLHLPGRPGQSLPVTISWPRRWPGQGGPSASDVVPDVVLVPAARVGHRVGHSVSAQASRLAGSVNGAARRAAGRLRPA